MSDPEELTSHTGDASLEESPASTAPPAPETPAAQPNLQRVDGPVYVKEPPAWTYFLTPAALVLGAIIVAATIWWTREDDSTTAGADQDLALDTTTPAASSTAPPVSGASGLLDTVTGYARQLGLDTSVFSQCVNNQQNVAPISANLQAGQVLGVTGTPTFFINNKKVVGNQPLAVFQEVIDMELKGSPTSLDGYSAAVRQLAATNPPAFAIVDSKPDVTGAAIEGNTNAKVMIAEFSDFQCPFCKLWTEQSLRTLRSKFGNDVALAFLHFPIVSIHPNAGNASLVAVCAGQQGKFWQMHDLLFARQTEWANLK